MALDCVKWIWNGRLRAVGHCQHSKLDKQEGIFTFFYNVIKLPSHDTIIYHKLKQTVFIDYQKLRSG